MQFDRFSNHLPGVLNSRSSRDAPRQVRNINAIAGAGSTNDYEISHGWLIAQARLLQNRRGRFGVQFIAWLTGDRHRAEFDRMLERAMANALSNHLPSITSKDTKDLANLHSLDPYQYTPTVVASANSWNGRTPLTPSQGYLP